MKQHAITLAHGTYTELKDTEGAKGTEDKLLWLDIQGTSEELTHFLKERQIPPFLRRRVLSSQRFPSVFSGNDYVLLSVPARKTWVQKRSVSITFILFAQEVITLCRDEGYNFDGERKQLAEGDTASIRSASDLLIALLDSLVETNICNFIEARSQTENLSLHVDNASGKISEQTILDTRRQINHLVNQFEDFFYGLADLHALTPHAMLSDAVREKLRDIRDAQNHLAKNTLRLVTRLSELLQHCQFVLQQQTDQRLRQLTVLSAIFMPLTLITGVYGMNFAYMPETGWRYGYYATLAGMSGSPFSCGLPSNGKAGSGKARWRNPPSEPPPSDAG